MFEIRERCWERGKGRMGGNERRIKGRRGREREGREKNKGWILFLQLFHFLLWMLNNLCWTFHLVVSWWASALLDLIGTSYVGRLSWMSSALQNTPLFTVACTPLTAQHVFLAIARPPSTSRLTMNTEEGGWVRGQILNHNKTRLCVERQHWKSACFHSHGFPGFHHLTELVCTEGVCSNWTWPLRCSGVDFDGGC